MDLGLFDVFRILVEWLGLDFHFDIPLMYGWEGIGLSASVAIFRGQRDKREEVDMLG